MSGGNRDQQAQDDMAQWLAHHRPVPPILPIPIGLGAIAQIGLTAENLIAAAGAGQFAVDPDIGQAINRQLATVQLEVGNMIRAVLDAAVYPRLGGGYAELVSFFVQGVAAGKAGSAEEVLAQFRNELEQLKEAISRSIGNYNALNSRSANGVVEAGGQL